MSYALHRIVETQAFDIRGDTHRNRARLCARCARVFTVNQQRIILCCRIIRLMRLIRIEIGPPEWRRYMLRGLPLFDWFLNN